MFIDLGLESMNGFELCKNIRNNNPEAIIYALSGYTGLYEPQQFVEAGFDCIFRTIANTIPIDREQCSDSCRTAFRLITNSIPEHPEQRT